MGRLIDTDTLIEDINTWTMQCDDIESIVMLQTVVDKIEKQPTAYDISRVVEELLALPQHSRWNPNSDNISRSKAIDAVRKGGVE
jgi:hypothetical protein